jgi:hypothetical protein
MENPYYTNPGDPSMATAAKKKPAVKKAAKKTAAPRRGRPPLAPDQRTVVGAVRLTPGEWEKFHALGGATWLRGKLAKA